jgi:hypothetical protein
MIPGEWQPTDAILDPPERPMSKRDWDRLESHWQAQERRDDKRAKYDEAQIRKLYEELTSA